MAVRLPSWPLPLPATSPLGQISAGRLAALGAVLVLSVVGGYAGYMRFAAPAPAAPLSVAPVRVGSLAATVSANGNVAQARQATLTFAGSGRIKEMRVKPGDRVTAGQVLAQLDTAQLEAKLAGSQSSLRTAQIRRDQLASGARPEDVEAARAALFAAEQKRADLAAGARPEDLASAQASLDQARASLESAEARYAQVRAGVTTADAVAAQTAVEQARGNLVAAQATHHRLYEPEQRDIDAARNTLASAEANLGAARAKLDLLRQGSTPSDIAAADASLAGARATLAGAQAKLAEVRRGPTPEDLAVAQATVDSSRASLVSAEAKLKYLEESPTPADLAAAERDVLSARASLAQAEATLHERRSTLMSAQDRNQPITYEMENAVRSAEASLASAQQSVTASEARLMQVQAGPTPADLSGAKTAVDQAVANLSSAEARLVQAKAGATPVDVVNAETAVEQAAANLRSAEFRLEQVKAGPTSADLKAAESSVQVAETSLADARMKLALLVDGPAEADVTQAESQVTNAEASLRSAEAKLALLMKGPTPEDLAIARSSVDSARSGLTAAETKLAQVKAGPLANEVQTAAASLASAKASLAMKLSPDQYDLLLAEEQVKSADVALRQAEIDVQNAQIVAPFDGVVVSATGNPGEQAGSAASIVIADISQVRIEVSVDENDVAKLAAGQRAQVTFDALPDEQLNGRVTVIAPSAVLQQGVATYPIWIDLDRGSRSLPGGMTASVSIVVDERTNVVVVPNRAIRQRQRARVVEVLGTDGTREERVVQVGLANDQMSEIVSGLRDGETVVIPTTTTAQPAIRGGSPIGGGPMMGGGRGG